MHKRIIPFLICIVCSVFLVHTFVLASEDVLEDEDVSTTENPIDLQNNRLKKTHIQSLDSFKWIYSTAVITAYFDDGSFKQGFALLLQNGFYLTSSELTYQTGLYPKKIIAKMQDDSADPLICIAQLQLQAMDSGKGLSLLKTAAFTDDYCNIRAQSYYHKRIYKKYAQNVFSPKPTQELIKNGLYFPIIKEADTFGVALTRPIREETYYDQKLDKEISYGYALPFDAYENFTFGKPYFDKEGDFLGIFSIIQDSFLPVLIKKEVIQDFICETEQKDILNQKISDGDSVCQKKIYKTSTKIANNARAK